MSRRMELTALAGIPTVRAGDNIAALIISAVREAALSPQDGDVVVLAQKIVSKAEGRLVHLRDVVPSPRAVAMAAEAGKDARVVELILRESVAVLRCRPGVIIVEHRSGLVMANAGIDASNVEGDAGDEAVLLLPEDADRSATALRAGLRRLAGCDIGAQLKGDH